MDMFLEGTSSRNISIIDYFDNQKPLQYTKSAIIKKVIVAHSVVELFNYTYITCICIKPKTLM